MLKNTSRTFFIPINKLKGQLQDAVASAYLCMRAIDEIEDHPELPESYKVEKLMQVHEAFLSDQPIERIEQLLTKEQQLLPEVTYRMAEWASLCPESARTAVFRHTAKMSKQMAEWVAVDWKIETEADLDGYTYSVAGMVGEMLSDIWYWYDGTITDRNKAVAFGRGLQAVNILRNRQEDMERGVNFFPVGWDMQQMVQYTLRNLSVADEYVRELKEGQPRTFCKIPLTLAHATVKLIKSGGNKLTRDTVLRLVNSIT
ncbi:squalene/phytoene synthase family protein [Paenibacillus yanchengensis]|uniref:Squalene/phytoene synthase family protein n=1 Tax=Paenibacillus yanchengensis TaxID=2035833 RepID=A0ABW4YPB7_9BACL